jgi:hypothetical protein
MPELSEVEAAVIDQDPEPRILGVTLSLADGNTKRAVPGGNELRRECSAVHVRRSGRAV